MQHPLGGGFSPVTNLGYGVSYNFASRSRLGFHVSSVARDGSTTDADRLAGHIKQVLLDWRAIVEQAVA